MTQQEKQEIIQRALAVPTVELVEKALRTPQALGRALFQANCIRKAERSRKIEAEVRKFERAIKGSA